MRFEGTLTQWNDDRGFGRIESTQGGEPIFVHISAWPRAAGRPRLNQVVTFEVEVGPKGKRARNVQPVEVRPAAPATPRRPRGGPARWGTATLFVIPAFLLLFVVAAVLWRPPMWVAAAYVLLGVITFAVYAADKAAATRGAWRVAEGTLHGLAILGGWPGALLAQQFLRHKSAKREFRQVFWATVVLNVVGLLVLVSPVRAML